MAPIKDFGLVKKCKNLQQFYFTEKIQTKNTKNLKKYVTENLFLLFVVIACEHIGTQSTQGTFSREHVSTQNTLASEHVYMQGTLASEHIRHTI